MHGCISGTGNRAGTGRPVFECTSGENVELDQLCDGNADCGAGDDETTPLCESKLWEYRSIILLHDCMSLLQISADTPIMVAVPSPGSVLPLPWTLAVQVAWLALLKVPVLLVENALVSSKLMQADYKKGVHFSG